MEEKREFKDGQLQILKLREMQNKTHAKMQTQDMNIISSLGQNGEIIKGDASVKTSSL